MAKAKLGIGKKKYGKEKMQRMAMKGKKCPTCGKTM